MDGAGGFNCALYSSMSCKFTVTKSTPMLKVFLFGFHAFDVASDARNSFFDLQNFVHVSWSMAMMRARVAAPGVGWALRSREHPPVVVHHSDSNFCAADVNSSNHESDTPRSCTAPPRIADTPFKRYAPLLFRRCDDNASVGHRSFLAALKLDGAWQLFVTIERSTGDAGNLFVVDDGLAVLHHGDSSADQRDVVGLPSSGLSRQFRFRRQEAVHSAHVVARRLFDGIGFHLNFVAATQIDAAIGILRTIEFHVQFKVFELLPIVDQLRAISRCDQCAILNLPDLGGIRRTHPPTGEVLAVEQRDGFPPLRSSRPFQTRRTSPGPSPSGAVRPI